MQYLMTQNWYSITPTVIESPTSFFRQAPYVSRIHHESRDSADIRLPASSHLSDFRTVQKHSIHRVGGQLPPPSTVEPHWRSSTSVFQLPTTLPLSFSSSFRGRRWKRWLRGTEKLIISDTNLSGLLGGW